MGGGSFFMGGGFFFVGGGCFRVVGPCSGAQETSNDISWAFSCSVYPN